MRPLDLTYLDRALPSGVASDFPTQALLWALTLLLRPKLVVETGCDMGCTAHVIGQALAANGYGRLVTCDIAPASVQATATLCMGLPVEARCCQGVELPELAEADLVFFDSSFDGRIAEMAMLKPEAVGVLHDWEACVPELPAVVATFAQHVLLPTMPGVAIFRR